MKARTAIATALALLAVAAPAAQAGHTIIPSGDGASLGPRTLNPMLRDVLQVRCPSRTNACTVVLHYSTAWAVARNSL